MKTTIYTAVFTFFMLLLCCGCKVKQTEVLKSDYQFVDKTKADVTANYAQTSTSTYDLQKTQDSSFNSWMNSNFNQNTEVMAVSYDTDKPIVPETGKPPVKSEITTKSSTEMSMIREQYIYLREQQQMQIHELDSIRNVVKDLSNYNVTIKEQLEETQTSEVGSESIKVIVLCVLIVIFVLFAFFKK